MSESVRKNTTSKTNECGRGHSKGICITKLVRLRLKGLSYMEIAKIVGCAKPTVYSRLKRIEKIHGVKLKELSEIGRKPQEKP